MPCHRGATEAGVEALEERLGQRDLGEQYERLSAVAQALGDRFDIKGFHAAVLENGALPLDVLEQQVDAEAKIGRPRQIYTGYDVRDYRGIDKR